MYTGRCFVMSFKIYVDSGANLTSEILRKLQIEVVPFTYSIGDEVYDCPETTDDDAAHHIYELLRNKIVIKTSMINTDRFMKSFRNDLTNEEDILYVGISSGISGTVQAAINAAESLKDEFPDRKVLVFDSLAAGLGTGLLACKAADMRADGMDIDDVYKSLLPYRDNLCEYFTVDDLVYLKRSGRLSGAATAIGTILHIKPVLRGDEEGHIVSYSKQHGRKKAIDAIVEMFKKKSRNVEENRVAISHGDCIEDAKLLAERIKAVASPKELIIAMHEPLTGSHVGPGMLGLFFFGNGR